jgi:hypothetical protein
LSHADSSIDYPEDTVTTTVHKGLAYTPADPSGNQGHLLDLRSDDVRRRDSRDERKRPPSSS